MPSMLSPVLIGRNAELCALRAALDRAEAGSGGALFLTGDPGVGKSRLASELSSLASERGVKVYRGRAVKSASPVPFRPVTDALLNAARAGRLHLAAGDRTARRRQPGPPGDLATGYWPYRSVLASLIPELRLPGRPEFDVNPLTVAEALLRMLAPGEAAGSLLILEDLQWADPETLATVDYMADNLAGRPVLVIATVRDDQPSPGLDLVRSTGTRRAAELLHVPRLSEYEAEEMARACLGGDPSAAAAAARLLAGCDGLPFAVEEILAAAVASGELEFGGSSWHVNNAVRTGMPESIVGSVRNRLAALGPQAAEVIVAAAVLGRQFDWTLLPAISGADEREVIAALSRARELQLIEPNEDDEPNEQGDGWLRFRHNLTREAIISGLLPPYLARASAAAAAAVEAAHPGLPCTWCELAAELYDAAGQHTRAARLLLEAGRRDLFLGALGSATDTLDAARTELQQVRSADPTLAADIDEARVKALSLTGDFARLGPVAQEAVDRLKAAGADPKRQARLLLMAARSESDTDSPAAAEHLSAARAVADRLGDPMISTWADAVAARFAMDVGDLDHAEDLARRSLASAEAAGLEGWAADVAFDALEVLGRRERVRDVAAARTAFERAAEIARGDQFAVQRISALRELGTIDVLEHGDTGRLAEASRLARQAGAIATGSAIDLQLANVWCLGPDLDQAMSAARRSEHGARLIKCRQVEAQAIARQALIHGIRADRRAARAAAQRAESMLPGCPEVFAVTWGQARVAASLFLDDVPRAGLESSTGIGYLEPTPAQSPRRAWAIYALLQTVGGSQGRPALERARAAACAIGWSQAWLAYAEAVLAGRDGQVRRATELAEQAAELFARYAPWWNHLVRRLIAEDAIRDGWGSPAAWMRDATREFDANGQDRLASASRRMLRKTGERVPRTGRGQAQVPAQMRRLGVTSREMDVFLLAVQGLSNADIASKLFISAKTVETHIASLVAKTGRSGRRDLVANADRVARA